jgi:quercetin 2,3-dioxygenase
MQSSNRPPRLRLSMRQAAWVRAAEPGYNPDQTDKMQRVLPFGLGTDPFLMLAEDWFSSTGFDWHPHRGFETVTYVVEGTLEHRDNAGGHGILGPGDLQWTTTGRGVLHTEVAHERKGVHTLQLWLNLPARLKMVEPRYQDLRAAAAPVAHGAGVEARVFAGALLGVTGPAALHTPAGVAVVDVDGAAELDVPEDFVAFFYVLAGSVETVDGQGGLEVPAGYMAWFPAGPGPIAVSGKGRFILYWGRPIGEPVAQHGPFVMNSREEIIQAVRDLQAGKFGEIPAGG